MVPSSQLDTSHYKNPPFISLQLYQILTILSDFSFTPACFKMSLLRKKNSTAVIQPLMRATLENKHCSARVLEK